MNPEAGRIWRENCLLAQEVAERWEARALELRHERDGFKLAWEQRHRASTAYVVGFCCFVLGWAAGLATLGALR